MSEVLEKIRALPKFGKGIGLERSYEAFTSLWDFYAARKNKVIHIIGSNGKGSTAHFLSKLLENIGFKTALFTSPHLYAFNERFQINNTPIEDDLLEEAWEYFLEGVKNSFYELDDFGSFEAISIMAAYVFCKVDIDFYIIEAGIGGRYDTTKLFGGHTAILTSVDLEHTNLLGNTLEEIAADKVDILSQEGTLITGWLPPSLKDYLTKVTASKDLQFIDVSDTVSYATDEENPLVAHIDLPDSNAVKAQPQTPSHYIVQNSLLGYAAAKNLLTRNESFTEEYCQTLESFSVTGRYETLSNDPKVMCDIAHTPNAISNLVGSLQTQYKDKNLTFILGISEDKSAEEICVLLARAGNEFILFPASHKGTAPDILQTHILRANPQAKVEISSSASKCAELVKSKNTDISLYVATGGIFSAIEFRTAWLGGDVSNLNFY